MRFTKPVCATCGSDKVLADAWASWDHVTQEWVLNQTFDVQHCEKCDGECSSDDVPLTGEELEEARAYYLALEHGWLPGDEDTATEYCDTWLEGDELDYTKPVPDEETP